MVIQIKKEVTDEETGKVYEVLTDEILLEPEEWKAMREALL